MQRGYTMGLPPSPGPAPAERPKDTITGLLEAHERLQGWIPLESPSPLSEDTMEQLWAIDATEADAVRQQMRGYKMRMVHSHTERRPSPPDLQLPRPATLERTRSTPPPQPKPIPVPPPLPPSPAEEVHGNARPQMRRPSAETQSTRRSKFAHDNLAMGYLVILGYVRRMQAWFGRGRD